jgi:hypothetical protein
MKGTCLVLVVMASLAMSVSGCGTVCNLASGEPEVYGGVARDVEFATSSTKLDVGNCREFAAIVLGIWFADVLVSGAADTVTLPLVLTWDRRASRAAWPVSGKTEPDRPPQYSTGASTGEALSLPSGPPIVDWGPWPRGAPVLGNESSNEPSGETDPPLPPRLVPVSSAGGEGVRY